MVLLFCFYEKFPVWHSPVYWLNKYLSQFLCFRCSLSGVSPFQGETVEETCRRITDVNYEFNPKHFDPISQQAKDFITALLVKNPKWVKAHSKLFFSLFFSSFFFTFSLESSPHCWSVGSTVRKFMQTFHELTSSNFHSRSQSFGSFGQRQGSISDADQKDRSPGNENVKFRVEEALIGWRISWQNWTLTLPVVQPCSQGLSSFHEEPCELPSSCVRILINFCLLGSFFPIGYTWSECWPFIIFNIFSHGSLTPLHLQWCLRCFWRLAVTYTRLYFNRRKRADCQICLNSPWIRVSHDECFLLDTPFS